ncbi:hypothetical protein CsSME_00037329 [Camellia sinensis var. sinensis]
MEFKAASDPSNRLNTWNQSTDPCSWYGVSCQQNRVSRLVLEGLDLHAKQPLRFHFKSLQPHRTETPLPLLQPVFRRVSGLRHVSVSSVQARSVSQQLFRPDFGDCEPSDSPPHAPTRREPVFRTHFPD